MKDFLLEYCLGYNIKLTYTNNKYTILSSGINKKGYPVIRAHKILKNCPKNISKSILGYYTDFNNMAEHLKTIKDYVEAQFNLDKYIIKAPNNEYINFWLVKVKEIENSEEILKELVELNITSIIQEDFSGNTMKLNENDPIKSSSDEILELNITVDYF